MQSEAFGVPKVSVVMSVYNEEAFVCEAIESVLGQSYEAFEFIIVNDGSTDDTGLLIERYVQSDKRITLGDTQNQPLGVT